ncbi:MAG: membrane protein insertase YidC [Acidobacteriales bacterium]|nr:membrane protein insertase YidC [Terriglobales bacterium]
MSEIRNPNLEPGAEKRAFLVIALTFVVLIIGQQLFWKPPARPAQQPKTVATETTQPALPATTTTAPVARTAPALQTKQATAEAETVIDNGLYRITLTNRGARVKSWILKQHQDDHGKPLDMVNHRAAEQWGYPLSLFTYDPALRDKLNSAMFVASFTGEKQAPASVTFEFSDGELNVRKSLSFDHSYVVKVETLVEQKGAPITAYPWWPAALGDQETGIQFASSRLDWYTGGRILRRMPHEGFIFKDHISDGNTVTGQFPWAGVVDQYFAAIFLPDDPANVAMVQSHKTIVRNPDEQDEEKRKKDQVSVLGMALGDPQGLTKLRLFVGPKDLSVLQTVHAFLPGAPAGSEPQGPNLEGAIDFGDYFGFIAKPLFLWLKWTHDHWISNWGWAIIVLTLIINAALLPLRFISMRSALKMQKIQPEVKAISRKYEGLKLTDPRQSEKQQEIQALYKREGINQLAGCLPTLLQLPFLVAFYTMLSVANELRHAPWLWVKDLSAHDPLYLLPVVMVGSMFLLQKMTPMAGMDPAQARMMQVMMPIMVGAFSFSFPAGLVLYWATGNLVGILQQYMMNQTRHAREVREHLAKREERKKKK